MRHGIGLIGTLILLVSLMAQTLVWYGEKSVLTVEKIVAAETQTVILDAGHGGEDGGAVSISGVPESRVNLEIVLKIDDVLGMYGIAPVLMRKEDISLHDEKAVTLREKKSSDLRNRADMVNQCKCGVLISIHQNTYPDERYHGTQIFYAPEERSQRLAQHIQQTVKAKLQPDNNRREKQISKGVYLMNHIRHPGVLIECGFLTNPQEEKRLLDADYQKKMAATIASAWLTFQG